MKDYIAVLEQADDGTWGAYVPDLPGCTAGGRTSDEAIAKVEESIRYHIDLLRESGEAVPEPGTFARIVHVA